MIASFKELINPKLFKALGDERRIAILAQLAQCNQAQNVKSIAGCCNVDFSVVSRHLTTLKEAGILAATKKGKEVHYHIDCQNIVATLRAIADQLEQCCSPKKIKGESDD